MPLAVGHRVQAPQVLMSPGCPHVTGMPPAGSQQPERAQPGPARKGLSCSTGHPSEGRKRASHGFFFFLKYVVIETLLASLTGLAVCQFSEPASHWLCQAGRKLLAAPHRESLLWLTLSLFTKSQFMQMRHRKLKHKSQHRAVMFKGEIKNR